MSQPITIPTMTVELVQPPRTKWEREYRSFLENLSELLKTHRGQFVAFHEGRMVDCSEDELSLASRVWDKYGYAPIHIGLVTELPPPPERMPSFRITSRCGGSPSSG
jgi:hypothetical protein